MDISEHIHKLKEIDFNNIDFNNVGDWPIIIKIIAYALSFLIVLILGYQFHLTDVKDNHERTKKEENTLKNKYNEKTFRSNNLDSYTKQLNDMEKSFEELVKQLPGETEVPGLLDDITFTARGSGLQVDHIKLKPETIRQFYVELPISISVKGSYHDIANFVSGTAALRRIVTLHDFTIKRTSKNGNLSMDIIAKTYRYNEKGIHE